MATLSKGALMSSKHDEYIKEIADEVIEQIKNSNAIWQKPWQGTEHLLPVNHQGNPYHGVNVLKLLMKAQKQGYDDNRWYTYNNAKEQGGQVRRGEKGTTIKFYVTTERQDKKDDKGNLLLDANGKPIKEEVKLDRPRVVTYNLFNAQQIDGLPPKEIPPKLEAWERHAKAEAIINGIQKQGLTIVHQASDRAYYSPSDDRIVMPERGQFETADLYYATLLHEIGHATGHQSRLHRDLSGGFGSISYAKEELRAEISSMIIGQQLQIGHDPSRHHAYLQSWVKVLENDPKEIFRAVKDADKISNYLMDLGKTVEVNEAEKDNALRPQDIEYLNAIGKDFSGVQAERTAKSFDEVREIAKDFVSKEITNEHDGLTAIISKGNLDKMLSNKAYQKSASLHVHLIAVANADKLFKNSVVGWQHQDKDELSGNTIHRAISPLKINNEIYLAKLTIKELPRQQGNRFYSIEAIEIENEKSPVPEMVRDDLDKKGLSQHRHNRALIDIIVENAQEYNNQHQKNLNISQDTTQAKQDGLPNQQSYQNIAQEKTYLYVPYEEKNQASNLGARYDPDIKMWYAPIGSDLDKFSEWRNPPIQSHISHEREFAEFLSSMGANLQGNPIMDGRWHRVHIDSDKANTKNANYVGWLDGGKPRGYFKNFKTGETATWVTKQKNVQIKTPAEIEQIKTQADEKQQAIYNKVAHSAKQVLDVAPVATNHPYLTQKGVQAHNLRLVPDPAQIPADSNIKITKNWREAKAMRDNFKTTGQEFTVLTRGDLLIPAFNKEGQLTTFQTISSNGFKSYLKNGQKSGSYLTLGEVKDGEPVLIAEGYATAATLHEQLGRPVVVAFDSGNLMSTALAVRENLPNSNIYLLADNDHQTEKQRIAKGYTSNLNAGIEKATEASKAVDGYVITPTFSPNDKGSDFNDLYHSYGLNVFKEQIRTQLYQIKGIENDPLMLQSVSHPHQRYTYEQLSRPNTATQTVSGYDSRRTIGSDEYRHNARGINDRERESPKAELSKTEPRLFGQLELIDKVAQHPTLSKTDKENITAWANWVSQNYKDSPDFVQEKLSSLNNKILAIASGEITLPNLQDYLKQKSVERD